MNKENIDDCKRVALALLASLPISIRTKLIDEANRKRHAPNGVGRSRVNKKALRLQGFNC